MVAIAAALVLVASGCGYDWTMRLGDPAHSSFTKDAGITAANAPTLRQIWRLPPPACNGVTNGAPWFATPVVLHGTIYAGDDFGCLHAIDEATGKIIWTKYAAYQPNLTCAQQLGIVSSINVQDDGSGNAVLYFHSPDGYLYKLRGSDGSQIWRSLVQIPSTTTNDVYAWSSPTVVNGKVIIGISSNCDIPFVQGQVRAYDASNGNLLWVHKTIPDGYAGAGQWTDAAVDANGDVYVSTGSTYDSTAQAHPNTTPGFEQYSIIKLNGSTGALMWKAPAPQYLSDPDYASSPILFQGGGVGLVGATNKDGWFRVYRQSDGVEVWQAQVGSQGTEADTSISSGGVWDGTHLFVLSNATKTGGTWTQFPYGVWTPQGGTSTPGSLRQLDPATGALVSVGGSRWELPMPSNMMGPCSMNANSLLVCAGGQLQNVDDNAHNNGVFVIDTTRPASSAIVAHLEDRPNGTNTVNFGEFAQPIIENGAILAANLNEIVKWGH
jgi:outer membrane protein assembly factor BamB